MRVDYTVQIWREGAQFVAQAMPIDVVSAGSTPEQARTALDEAVGLFLSTAQQVGTLPEILEECSYEHDESGWRTPGGGFRGCGQLSAWDVQFSFSGLGERPRW